MQALSDVDVIDTDPLVTMPLIRTTVSTRTLPQIPSLATQILIATEAMRRRAEAPARKPPGPPPDSRSQACADAVLGHLLPLYPEGLEGADIWHWLRAAHPGEKWSRSVLDSALSRLCRFGLVDNRPGSPGRRLYVARGIA